VRADPQITYRLREVAAQDYSEALTRLLKSAADEIDALREIERMQEWRPISIAPTDQTLFLAVTADGRMMIFRGDMLAHAMKSRTPDHLTFPATHWMPLPSVPTKEQQSEAADGRE